MTSIVESITVLASELGRATGAIGVGIGGSRALGLDQLNSDWDLVLVFGHENFKDPLQLRAILEPLSESGSINVFGNYLSGACRGAPFEIFQKSNLAVLNEFRKAQRGEFGWKASPLFPHGDISTRLLSHIKYMNIAWQRDLGLTKLQESIEPFPKELRKSLCEFFCQRAAECIISLRRFGHHSGMYEAIGLLSAFVAHTSIILCAAHDLYPVIEKGRDAFVKSLPRTPTGYFSGLTQGFELIQNGDWFKSANNLEQVLADLRILVR